MPAKSRKRKPKVPFSQKLVLNQWILDKFGVEQVEDLIDHLSDPGLEGLDENNIHRFHHALVNRYHDLAELPPELLLEYDQNIVAHTLLLNDGRRTRGDDPLVWKHFQYLMLLATEIYLDQYFHDPERLRKELNTRIQNFNERHPSSDHLAEFDGSGEGSTALNKLAYWSATGSGKTLVMHANILQYRHYLKATGRSRELNRIILLTPNENLSRQHLRDLEASGFGAARFSKEGRSLLSGLDVEILEITKLRDEMGDRTVAVEAFEGNNLVLVDEGHRGASGGEDGAWIRYRNQLCEKGFSFEYSATFGQAVKGSHELIDQYARSIVFDYSYRHFHSDGFGKDFQILNLDESTQERHSYVYNVACLLIFFQQLRVFGEGHQQLRPFRLEKPLWVFVGGSVTATFGKKEQTDVFAILDFFAEYVSERGKSVDSIRRVLSEGLVNSMGEDLFSKRFSYLNSLGLTPQQIYEETLALVFNAPGGGILHVENMKGQEGEVALRLGVDSEPFGVINVGNDSKLVRLCESKGMDTGESQFGGSLFHAINETDSPVKILVGSRKFTEGWSSYRVSTMGLMNVGRGEGTQIIQLFGRGVRLRGFGMSLKRSRHAELPPDVEVPRHIEVLETLAVFGIRANYMAQFRDFLQEEGLPSDESRIELTLPVVRNGAKAGLKTIQVDAAVDGMPTESGNAFRKLAPIPTLMRPNLDADPSLEYLLRHQVALNWYPKIRAIRSSGVAEGEKSRRHEDSLTSKHLAFVDFDRLFLELQAFKTQRGWHNLNISKNAIKELLEDPSWYRLQIPPEELQPDSFAKVTVWQEVALALMKKYVERYYTFRKREWEEPHLSYRDLAADDPNLVGKGSDHTEDFYRVVIQESDADFLARLNELRDAIATGKTHHLHFRGFKTIWFDRHLYEPLIHLDGRAVDVTPVPLNRGEARFVEDLKAFHDGASEFFDEIDLYLLRNLSRGKGIGFFEAGGYYPDFVLWLLSGDRQHIVFVDPKGVRNLEFTDPKIEFHEEIRKVGARIGDPRVSLHSFIVSVTPSHRMQLHWGVSKDVMTSKNILFQSEDRDSYIQAMLEKVLQEARVPQT